MRAQNLAAWRAFENAQTDDFLVEIGHARQIANDQMRLPHIGRPRQGELFDFTHHNLHIGCDGPTMEVFPGLHGTPLGGVC